MDEARISIDGVENKPVARIQSPSSMETDSSSRSVLSSELSSKSWSTLGKGPMEHASILLVSAFRVICSWRSSSRHPEQQHGGHLDIWTFPVSKSISGLCLCNLECPSINFCLPRPVTQKVVRPNDSYIGVSGSPLL